MIDGVNNNANIKIVVIGVGGGGGNAVNNMVASAQGTQVKFVVVNTDGQDIEKSTADSRILITTKNKTNAGLGAGAKPEVGADAAENCLDVIAKELEGANLCFISAGLGGGTGTGAAPVIADFAKNHLGITTVAAVTRPFSWEGKKRAVNAEAGLAKLLAATDALIEIPNDKVVDMSSKKTSLTEAFKAADNILRDAVLGITDLITKTGIINLDFADVQAIVKEAGKSHMGIGSYSCSGEEENPVIKALNIAIDSPLLETSIDGAKRVMINYASASELSMLDISEANQMVYDRADEDVNLIWGAATDPTLPEGEVKVTVIAADFSSIQSKATISSPQVGTAGLNSQPVGGASQSYGGASYSSPLNKQAEPSPVVDYSAAFSNREPNVYTGYGNSYSPVQPTAQPISNKNVAGSQFGGSGYGDVKQSAPQSGVNIPSSFNPRKFTSLFSRK